MPYLPNSQEFLEQSSLLLEAYPDTTRITTRYSYPSLSQKSHPRSKPKITDPSATTESQTQQITPIATLTLKTFNPTTGICLKYRTNKAAEVGRLITGLGKLAAGAKIAAAGGDVEMVDAAVAVEEAPAPAPAPVAAKTEAGPGAKGGKSKKKGGKGKR